MYRVFKRDYKAAIIAALIAFIAACVAMVPLNLIFTPMYGVPVETVRELLIPAIIPFNLIKFGINTVISLILYRLMYASVLKNREQ